jgi:WD40 repeat protein
MMHTRRKHTFITLAILLLATLLLKGQTEPMPDLPACYEELLKEGRDFLDQEVYDKAINKFIAAGSCDDQPKGNKLDTLIQYALNEWVAALDAAKENAESEARRAEAQADIAEEQKKIAEVQEALAREEALFNYAYYIAFLATQEVEKNNREDAFALAFHAYDTLAKNEKPIPLIVEKALGDAVYAKFAKTIQAHPGGIIKIVPAPTGSRFLTLGRGSALRARLWEIEAPWSVDCTPGSHGFQHSEYILDAAFSGDGQRIVTASRDRTAKLWTLAGEDPVTLPHESAVLQALFMPGDEAVLTLSLNGGLSLWDLQGNPLDAPPTPDESLRAVSLSPGGAYLMLRSPRWLDIRKTANLRESQFFYSSQEELLLSAAFSPDDRRVIFSAANSRPLLLELPDDSTRLAQKAEAFQVAFAHSEPAALLLAGSDGVRIWKTVEAASSGNLGPSAWLPHSGVVHSAQFSPGNSNMVLTAGSDGTARLWNAQGELIMNLSPNAGPVDQAVFTADGRFMIVGTGRGLIAVCPAVSAVLDEIKNKTPGAVEWLRTLPRRIEKFPAVNRRGESAKPLRK